MPTARRGQLARPRAERPVTGGVVGERPLLDAAPSASTAQAASVALWVSIPMPIAVLHSADTMGAGQAGSCASSEPRSYEAMPGPLVHGGGGT